MSSVDHSDTAIDTDADTAMPRRPRLNRRRKFAAGGLAVLMAAGAAPLLLAPGSGSASSHREAPLIAGLPQLDNTDVYAFRSPENDGTVTLLANWIPFEEPAGGPNFYPFSNRAAYDINIDNNGDGYPDITFRWTFGSYYENDKTFLYNTNVVNNITDKSLNFKQWYNLRYYRYSAPGKHDAGKLLAYHAPVAPSNVGTASMPDYGKLRTQSIKSIGPGIKSFAGQSDDPFFLDLRVFDLLYGGDRNRGFTEVGNDTLKGYSVNTVGIKLPRATLALNHNPSRNPAIGVWSATVALDSNGRGTQVSRLGNPLVNEVVVPVKYKDAFNQIPPFVDHTLPDVVNKVLYPEVPMLVKSIYGINAPATPRNDLFEVFLTGIGKKAKTAAGKAAPIQLDLNSQLINKDVVASKFTPSEMLRLNVQIPPTTNPNRLGVLGNDLQGFPNGRRLTDDVVDIELRALEGALAPYSNGNTTGDSVNANNKPFLTTFPYTALPDAGSATR